jgi:flagellar biosynthesis protein FlhG
VQIPPTWLRSAEDGAGLLRWMLLFTSPDSRDLRETYGIVKLLLGANAGARLGITVHGARRRDEAENAFSRLARTTRKFLGFDLSSYGLLVDDLHVYRAIVAQRPIGLAYPQSAAARSLCDVAQMLLEDVEKAARV